MTNKIAIIGGDMRHKILYELLKADGYQIDSYATDDENTCLNLDNLKIYDTIILPMPVTQDGIHINTSNSAILLDDVFQSVLPDTVILGGKLPKGVETKYTHLHFFDYLEREDFAIKNAVATAEGALSIAITETPYTIWNSRCLVTGFGRISKILVRMLKALGADVDVSARKCSDRAWAHTMSCNAYDTSILDDYIDKYDLIFNTVPQKILTDNILSKIHNNTLIIDLASKPGGVDFDAAKKYGINVIWALSLPGKIAPYTSGKILKDTIVNIFNEINK